MSGVSGGGWRAGLQGLLQKGQEAFNKVKSDLNNRTGADAKGEVKGGGTAAGAGGAAAAKGKAKAKGADASAVDRLLGGSDDFGVQDEDKEKRRRQRFFLGNDDGPRDFQTQDATAEKSAVAHISAEFRGQVASGLTAGRSFTQGSCVVPEEGDEEHEDVKPKNKRR